MTDTALNQRGDARDRFTLGETHGRGHVLPGAGGHARRGVHAGRRGACSRAARHSRKTHHRSHRSRGPLRQRALRLGPGRHQRGLHARRAHRSRTRPRARASRRSCASNSTPGISCAITSSRWDTSRCRRPTSRSSASRKRPGGGVRRTPSAKARTLCATPAPATDEAALDAPHHRLGRAHAERAASRWKARACTCCAAATSAGASHAASR